MTPEEYCYQKVALPGLPFYYSIARLPSIPKDMVTAITALYQELKEVVFECHDIAVAYAKLNWWRSEIARLEMGKPSHPVALVLQKHLAQFHLSPQLFVDMIDGIESRMQIPLFNNFEEVVHYIKHTEGLCEVLIAKVSCKEFISPELIYQLSLFLELAQDVQHLHQNIKHAFSLLTIDRLAEYSIDQEDLHKYKTTDAIYNLLQFQADKSLQIYHKALAEFKHDIYPESLLIRCEIARANLHEIAVCKFYVLEKLVTLTPLRHWWIAFKTRQRFHKKFSI